MKKFHIKKYVCILGILINSILLSNNVCSASTASGTWLFTSDATATSSGNVTAATSTNSGFTSIAYASGTSGGKFRDPSGWWTSKNTSDYIQFTLQPNSGYTFTASSLSLNLGVSSTYLVCDIAYSTDGTTFTNLNSSTISFGSSSSKAGTAESFSFSSTVTVSSSQTLYIRIIPWATASTSSKYIYIGNVILSGTTTSTCTAPTITTQPATTTASYCLNATNATALSVATSASTPSYQWYKSATGSTNDTIAISGATSASCTPLTTTAGTSYYLCKVTSGGCSAMSSASGLITVNALPTITLGSMPTVVSGTTSANLAYTATTGSPDQYSITWNASASSAGFSNVTNATLGSSPIVLTVPSGASTGTYTGTLTVTNSTTGCVSSSNNISVTISATTIATSAVTGGPFCAGGAVSVPFTSTGTFNSGNTYTAQLSDASGSFSSPTTIGTLTSNSNSGTISATIPAGTTAGTGYRIRVIASSPSTTGTDNGTDLTVYITPSISTQPGSASILTGNTTTLSLTAAGTGLSYQWYSNTTASTTGSAAVTTGTGGTTASYTTPTLTTGTYYYYCIVTGTCGTVTSSLSTVTVTASSAPKINVTQDGTTYANGSTYDFGTTNTQTNITKIFTIQNTGTANLTVTSTTTTGTPYNTSSSISSSYPQTVRPGQSTSVAIRQYSSSAGTLSGTLTIVSSDATYPSYVITLKGTAVSPGTTPTIASATNATNVGFKENWTALSGVDGYYVKACKVSSAPTLLINQTIGSWTQFPTNSELTCSTPFCTNHNAATTQVTGDGTFVIENAAIIPSSGCAFVQLGKIGNTSAINCSISFSEGASGGAITFPLVASAGTLTLSIAGSTSSTANYFSVLKSTDGGKSFTTLGNLTNTTTTPATVSMTINEPNPCIIKLLSIKSNYMRVYSIKLTNYVDCSTPTQVAGASSNNYTFTTLDPNTTYYYSAASYTGANVSNYSTLVNTTTQILTLPNPPTLNAATKIGATTFTCNWTAPTVTGDAAYTYTLEYSTTSDFSSGVSDIASISSGTTTYTITGLTPLTQYYYRVKTVNASGNSASTTSSVTTLAGKNLILTISPTGSGTVSANGTILSASGTYAFAQDSDVVLKAIPGTGYGFLRWIINDSRYADNPYTINMSDNMTVTAQFAASSCNTYNFDDLTSTNLSTSATTASFTEGSKTWNVINSRLNTSSSYSHSTSNSIRLAASTSSSTYGSLVTPAVSRPTSLSFYTRMYNTGSSYVGTLTVYMSTDGGNTFTPIDTISGMTGSTWQQVVETPPSTPSTNVKFKIVNAVGTSSSTSYDIVIDDVNICEGADATPPSLTFIPRMDSTNVGTTSTLTITSDEKLYYYTSSGTYVALDNTALSDASVLSRILSLTKVSDGSDIAFTATISSDGKTISITPTSALAYSTQYKLSIKYVADANENMLTSTLYTRFTTRGIPEPRISVKDNGGLTSYANGSSYNMGTLISATSTSATFKVYNTGSDPLTITSSGCSVTGTGYSVGTISKTSISYGDSATVTVTFTNSTAGVYQGTLSIVSNDLTNTPYIINLTTIKANFVLPYTYQSGCTSPVVSSSELTHDYSTVTDIPTQIQIGNLSTSSAVTTANFNPSYSLFHAEGNCIADGNSALRVGSSKKSLVLNVDSCGQITFKWTASGYRKVSVTDAAGNVYLQSSTWLEGSNCYTNSVVINSCTKGNNNKIMISFEASDSTILTTLYYLNITKCSAELKSSAKDIVKYSFGDANEKVRIYDNYIFVTLPSSYAGSLSSLVAKTIEVSPKATVAITTTGDNFSDSTVTYTVTAEDGTTKQYTVSLEISTTHSNYYANSIDVTVDMKEKDKTLSVLEISNNTCTVPSSGTGSDYTIYFLNQKTKPVGGYKISGLTKLCVGSIATYSLSNATKSNNPSYKWSLTGAGKDQFTIVGDTLSPTLTIQAPTTITGSVALELAISVGFNAASCTWTKGGDTINIQVTKTAPDPATSITGGCLDENGYLTLTAHGAGASATTYNWNFTPSTTKISSQNDSSVVLNIGSSVNDISATINTQNGCGITKGTTTFPVDYATAATTWTGKTSADWNTSSNWTARVPKSCTNVTIPDVSVSGVSYPTISSTGECNYITFEPGGAVLGLQNLTYNKAFVEIELQRNKWYTLTAPLKNMYSGDYYFSGGAPVTYMRLFDTVNPDSASSYTYTGTWTKTFATLKENLTPGEGFAYKIDTTIWNYPKGKTYTYTNKTLTFPRMNLDSSLITKYIPYSASSGKLLTALSIPVTRYDSIAYRFALENNSNKLTDLTVNLKKGLNLIGNPLMTHIDVAKLVSDNSSISSTVRFWNGSNFVTYMSGSDLWSATGYSGSLIAPMQSFIVNAPSAGTLTFKLANDFTADVAQTSKLRAATTKENLMYIKSDNGTTTSSTAITKNSEANNKYDSDDAFKLFTSITSVPDVYTLAEGVALDINQFSEVPYTTPLAIKTTQYGKITLTFTGAESFGDDVEVSLINTATSENINLKEQSTYTFTLDSTNAEGKLFVDFKDATVTSNTEQTATSSIQIYTKDNNVIRVISAPNNLIKAITVMDETGKKVVEKSGLSNSLFDMVMNNGDHVYIVRAVTEKEVKIAKVLIK